MKFSLIVYGSPESPGASTALGFAGAVLAQGHELYRVFFYGEGVWTGADPATNPDLSTRWSTLARHHQTDLVLCVTAAEQRGISRAAEGFQLSGLGQMVDAMVNSDRCLTFR